jgi:hypothetical protein
VSNVFSDPARLMQRLDEIERDLATRQGEYERAALGWYRMKREREKARAEAFIRAEGTVAERNAIADVATATMGQEDEAAYEAHKAVVRVLDTRASIGQSLLRAHGRA